MLLRLVTVQTEEMLERIRLKKPVSAKCLWRDRHGSDVVSVGQSTKAAAPSCQPYADHRRGPWGDRAPKGHRTLKSAVMSVCPNFNLLISRPCCPAPLGLGAESGFLQCEVLRLAAQVKCGFRPQAKSSDSVAPNGSYKDGFLTSVPWPVAGTCPVSPEMDYTLPEMDYSLPPNLACPTTQNTRLPPGDLLPLDCSLWTGGQMPALFSRHEPHNPSLSWLLPVTRSFSWLNLFPMHLINLQQLFQSPCSSKSWKAVAEVLKGKGTFGINKQCSSRAMGFVSLVYPVKKSTGKVKLYQNTTWQVRPLLWPRGVRWTTLMDFTQSVTTRWHCQADTFIHIEGTFSTRQVSVSCSSSTDRISLLVHSHPKRGVTYLGCGIHKFRAGWDTCLSVHAASPILEQWTSVRPCSLGRPRF